jgi:hypothetical protein
VLAHDLDRHEAVLLVEQLRGQVLLAHVELDERSWRRRLHASICCSAKVATPRAPGRVDRDVRE